MSWPQDKIREHRLDEARRRDRIHRLLRDAFPYVTDLEIGRIVDEILLAWDDPRPLS